MSVIHEMAIEQLENDLHVARSDLEAMREKCEGLEEDAAKTLLACGIATLGLMHAHSKLINGDVKSAIRILVRAFLDSDKCNAIDAARSGQPEATMKQNDDG